MRQRIGVEQLKQLAPSQQEKLREWWRPQLGDCIAQPDVTDRFIFADELLLKGLVKENCLPLLSTGQCIELLFELNAFRKWHSKDEEILNCGYDTGWIGLDWSGRIETELIDSLFEAVKSIL